MKPLFDALSHFFNFTWIGAWLVVWIIPSVIVWLLFCLGSLSWVNPLGQKDLELVFRILFCVWSAMASFGAIGAWMRHNQ
jgi:uncharacterized RDD family membrane protein YckC